MHLVASAWAKRAVGVSGHTWTHMPRPAYTADLTAVQTQQCVIIVVIIIATIVIIIVVMILHGRHAYKLHGHADMHVCMRTFCARLHRLQWLPFLIYVMIVPIIVCHHD